MLAGLVLIGREGVKLVTWPPGYVTTSRVTEVDPVQTKPERSGPGSKRTVLLPASLRNEIWGFEHLLTSLFLRAASPIGKAFQPPHYDPKYIL